MSSQQINYSNLKFERRLSFMCPSFLYLLCIYKWSCPYLSIIHWQKWILLLAVTCKSLSSISQSQLRNTPGTRGGSGFQDWTLAIKRRKNNQKSAFVKKNFKLEEKKEKNTFLLVMLKYEGGDFRRRGKRRGGEVKTMASFASVHHHG